MDKIIATTEVVSILVLAILAVTTVRYLDKNERTTRIYFVYVMFGILGCTTDALSYLYDGLSGHLFLLYCYNYISLISGDFLMVLTAFFLWASINEKVQTPKTFAYIVLLACFGDFIFNTVGVISGTIFSIADSYFVEGPLYRFVGCIQIVMILYCTVYMIRKRQYLGSRAFLAMSFYFILPVTAIVISFLIPGASFTYLAVTLVQLIIYIGMQASKIERSLMRENLMSELSNHDSLTGLSNRRAYDVRLDELADASGVGALFCDLNGLKYVNDRYGHVAGDEMITKFAELLTRNFRQNDLYRISGDEFVVLLSGLAEETFLQRAEQFRQTVAICGDIAAVGYFYADGECGASVLISKAEKNMYEEKNAHYEKNELHKRNL